RPGGLFTEVAAYYVWRERLVSGDSWAELLTSTLDEVAKRFEHCAEEGLLDPVLGTSMKPEIEAWRWLGAAQTFGRLAEEARTAMDSGRCMAAKLWREILGSNDRGPVLPLPDGCDAEGNEVGPVTAVDAIGSNQPRGFAVASARRTPGD